METRIVARDRLSKSLQLLAMMLLALCSACAVCAQDGRWNFNIGGGIGFPTGDLSSFINSGGNFVAGGGYKINEGAQISCRKADAASDIEDLSSFINSGGNFVAGGGNCLQN